MRIRYFLLLALLVAAFPAAAQDAAAPADNLATFTVLAEPQLALPMTEITRLYSLQRGVSMLSAFDDSVTQAQRLLEGESGDVLITSYPPVITDLRQRGIVDVYSQTTVTGDALVLAAPESPSQPDDGGLMAALDALPVLLADPKRHVEGLYGHEAMPYLYYNRAMPHLPVEYASRGAMYDAIRAGTGIGVLLQSEAKTQDGLRLAPLADAGYPQITYQALVVAGENMPMARDFTEFLRSSEAQRIFTRYGFTRP